MMPGSLAWTSTLPSLDIDSTEAKSTTYFNGRALPFPELAKMAARLFRVLGIAGPSRSVTRSCARTVVRCTV